MVLREIAAPRFKPIRGSALRGGITAESRALTDQMNDATVGHIVTGMTVASSPAQKVRLFEVEEKSFIHETNTREGLSAHHK